MVKKPSAFWCLHLSLMTESDVTKMDCLIALSRLNFILSKTTFMSARLVSAIVWCQGTLLSVATVSFVTKPKALQQVELYTVQRDLLWYTVYTVYIDRHDPAKSCYPFRVHVRGFSNPFHWPSANVAAWLNIKYIEGLTLFSLLLKGHIYRFQLSQMLKANSCSLLRCLHH